MIEIDEDRKNVFLTFSDPVTAIKSPDASEATTRFGAFHYDSLPNPYVAVDPQTLRIGIQDAGGALPPNSTTWTNLSTAVRTAANNIPVAGVVDFPTTERPS